MWRIKEFQKYDTGGTLADEILLSDAFFGGEPS